MNTEMTTMNDLVPMNDLMDSGNPFPVSGRKLHELLQIDTPYTIWFGRTAEQGFTEGEDFLTKMLESTGGRPSTEHFLSLFMAKHIALIQRTPIGQSVRTYLIKVEEAWNKPVLSIGRAWEMTRGELAETKTKLAEVESKCGQLENSVYALQPRANFHDAAVKFNHGTLTGAIAKLYGHSAVWLNNMLEHWGIQQKLGRRWYLTSAYDNLGYTRANYSTKSDHSVWTPSGVRFVHKIMAENGYEPLRPDEQLSLHSYATIMHEEAGA